MWNLKRSFERGFGEAGRGVLVLQQKQHDGCEIQLLEGEDIHTLFQAEHL